MLGLGSVPGTFQGGGVQGQRFLVGEQCFGAVAGADQPVQRLGVVVTVAVVECQLADELVEAVGVQRFDGFADRAVAGAALRLQLGLIRHFLNQGVAKQVDRLAQDWPRDDETFAI